MDCAHSGLGVRKGAWTDEEDDLLRKCIEKHGERKWVQVPMRAGLNRCRKSCRLRWLNYLRPNINRGNFLEDEVDLIIRLHRLLGNRWSLIAGRLPGRTANDIKNYWNSHISKRVSKQTKGMQSQVKSTKVIRPQPRTVSPNSKWLIGNGSSIIQTQLQQVPNNSTPPEGQESSVSWWKSLLAEEEETMKEMGTRRLTSREGGPGDQVMADCFEVDETDQKKSQEEDDQLMGGAFEEETLKEMGTWPLTSWEGGPGDQDMADCFGVEETDQRNSNEEDDLLMGLAFGDWEENMILDMDLFML